MWGVADWTWAWLREQKWKEECASKQKKPFSRSGWLSYTKYLQQVYAKTRAMQKNMAYYSPTIANKLTASLSKSSVDETQDPMMALHWFHPNLTRHAADCMLIDNAPEGSYLLRGSSDYQSKGTFVLSVKLTSSVQHIRIQRTDLKGYKFGNITFDSVESFRRHFELEKPVIGSDSGITVVLNFPYLRFIKESHIYTDVVHHAVTNMLDSSSEMEGEDSGDESDLPQPLAIDSKEGYLTKQGRIVKNWKTRWFILRSSILCYYKTKQSRRPIDRLDLSKATAVEYDNSKQKDYCFRIDFVHRTYFMYALSAEDCDQWVELLRSKLPVPERATLPVTSALATS